MFADSCRSAIGSMLAVCAITLAAPTLAQETPEDIFGPKLESAAALQNPTGVRPQRRSASTADTLRFWNQIAIDASGLDHTPVQPGENRVFGEQVGPGRSSRAIAIVHIAILDAVNAIVGGYHSYTRIRPARQGASVDSAIAQAAHDTLVAMFPSQRQSFDDLLTVDLPQSGTRDAQAKANGREVGRRAAAAILALRANDGSAKADPRMDTEYLPG